jgi:Cu/Ag efflux protein CusF
MTIAKIILASAAAVVIMSSGALAQEFQTTGQILKIDQASGKITLQHKQGGTTGSAAAKDLVDEYKIQDGLAYNALKPGDQVVYTEAQVEGVWTVTKIQKQ